MKNQNLLDMEKRHIEARKRLNKRQQIIPISHIGVSKRQERMILPSNRFGVTRPSLKDYMEKQIKGYETEHNKKAGSSVKKFWKKAYRKLYGVKNCGKPAHDITRIKAFRIVPVKLHKPVKKSESLGAGMDMEQFQHKYMEKWRQES